MKADILTLKTLFQKDVRYVIPTFQRPYVWNQEDQWEPLWNDVRNVAEQYLEELAALGEGSEAVAEERAGRHFLGAVVLQQQATSASELETRHVIWAAAPDHAPAHARCSPGGLRARRISEGSKAAP